MRTRERLRRLIAASLVGLATIAASTTADRLSPAEARNHIGERATVCGIVASTRYAMNSRGQPTFLNLDKPYPDHVFTVVIWGSNRTKFPSPPEQHYNGKSLCVTGEIASYRGIPQIAAESPKQIAIVHAQE